MNEAFGNCELAHTGDSLLECMEGRHGDFAVERMGADVAPERVVETPSAPGLPERVRSAEELEVIADFFNEQAGLAMRANSE